MAKYRIRRWFQFSVLDLLILTTIVAVVVVLWRPLQVKTTYQPLAEGATPGQKWSSNGLRMEFCWCPPGEFKMGEAPNQVDVTLTRGFWLGKYEVRQDEYDQVRNDDSSRLRQEGRGGALDADTLPVEHMSWQDAVEFCRLLTEQERKAGRLPADWEYRLPTEAQWEYSCRAGTQTLYSFGDDESRLADFAWYDRNSDYRTHEVGQKLPNPWGLHDMHGNLWEWCSDGYQDTLVGGTDPEAKATERASFCVSRGGGWYGAGWSCRSVYRNRVAPGNPFLSSGFRVALVQSR